MTVKWLGEKSDLSTTEWGSTNRCACIASLLHFAITPIFHQFYQLVNGHGNAIT